MKDEIYQQIDGCIVYINSYFPDSDEPESEEFFDMGVEYEISDGKITNRYYPYDSYDLNTFDVRKDNIAEDLCIALIIKAFNNCDIYRELLDAEVALYGIIKTEDDDIIDEAEIEPIKWFI